VESDHTVHLVKAAAPSAPAASNAGGAASPLNTSPFGAMLNDPLMSQLMDNLLQDPEALRNMFASNPQMSAVLSNNPEVARLLSDPDLLRQSMAMARNPNLLREQMRNTDRALSNLETHPEGFQALRRLYEDVQLPLGQAMGDTQGAVPAANQNPFAGLFSSAVSTPSSGTSGAPNASPLPNPWAPSQPATGSPGAAGALPNVLMPPLDGMSPFGMNHLTPEAMEAMLSSPGAAAAMEQMISNPQLMEAMIMSQPQMRSMVDANPQLRAMLSNPQLMRAMMDPSNVRAMMQMQSAMQQLQAGGLGMPSLGALPGFAGVGAPAAPANPEEAYSQQLTQLQEMGFYDRAANVRALVATGGNVSAACERLLNSM